jgi:hypothetical protein
MEDKNKIYGSIIYGFRAFDQSDGELTGLIIYEKSHKL